MTRAGSRSARRACAGSPWRRNLDSAAILPSNRAGAGCRPVRRGGWIAPAAPLWLNAALDTTGGSMAWDVLVKNGTLVDGTGREPVRADVAVQGERIAAIGKLDGSAGARDRRRGRAGHPRLHRHPHPSGRADLLGPARDFSVLARRHLGGDGQLRRHLRPLQAGGPRVPGAVDGVGRGHPGQEHHDGAALGLGDATASISTRSTGCPRA